ncbi:putative FAD dependent oxidoreductase [Aspergillus ibericus CBS 121593]|uniref:Pantothenate transporter n=1 Tax=Aspergillus ibericus CBS 121593 TaxID=1448316 RepID=A0A395GXZ1_9EURO|nr:pantothenate transporter [Aspergillus ibericus CBS 121593]RAK99928.1 pantothenate transporter [Aspergillus ibericus CBS 121593]
MTRRIQRVAVIGAGISGVVSAAHLLVQGIDVTVFERNHAAGGVWLHDERTPLEPNYPSMKPSVSEKHRDDDTEKVDLLSLEHAPPGPCYDGLKNNVATSLMRVKLNAWPEGTPEFVSHRVMKEYIQDTSKKAGADGVTVYGARVNRLRKNEQQWHVTWSTLKENDQSGSLAEQEETAVFDAVIVASGHYHAPRVPDVPGLAKAKSQWPSRILHSKAYRKPDSYADKNVLLIGGGVSSTDLAREIGPLAKTVYQSTRNGEFDISSSVLPDNGVRVSEIERFEVESPTAHDNESLPMAVHLKSGQKLCGIDAVIICTGYHITLPFLSEYHDDATPAEKANETILVTDGTQVHNLHKDIFYIPDPTLAFVGVPYYTATFTLFEFQAIVVANVFAGIADLPFRSEMRDEYTRKIKEKGSGKRFHSLKDVEEFYVLDLLEWINADREKHGLPAIEGHSDSWHAGKAAQRERVQLLLGPGRRRDSGIGELPALEVETAVMAPSSATADERVVDDSSGIIQKAPKRKWVSYLWDTFDKSPEERRLLFKLDSAILTFASLGYFIKYLDQVNINNAFVSGMKEDLGLYGNQLNYMQACWTVGYVIGEIPSNMLLTRIRPRYWIPAMELLWTVLTFILSRSTNATHFYVLRFFIGLAESSFYPGMQYIIGSWYRKDELAKRSCIFHTSSGIASMFSGYLMAAVYNLGGRGGLKGWQWLFMIDGIISIPVAISGFFILPDVPEISNPFYLTEQEVKLAQKRMEFEGRKNREPYTKAKLKKIFSSWRIYLLTIVYMYLKDSTNPKYTVDQINAYPTTTNAVQVVTTLIYAWTSDTILKGRRWPCIIIGACVNIICYVSLAIWDIPTGWKWTCYILSGAGFGLSGLCMAWAHEICTDDNEERALVVGSMNEMAYVFQAWLPLIVWQQVDGPQYRKGFITVTIMSVILIISTMATRHMQHWEDGRRAKLLQGEGEGSSESDLRSSREEGPVEEEQHVPKL